MGKERNLFYNRGNSFLIENHYGGPPWIPVKMIGRWEEWSTRVNQKVIIVLVFITWEHRIKEKKNVPL